MMSKESRLRQLQTRVKNFLGRDVWDTELVGLPTFRAIGVRSARIVYLAVRGLMKNECLNQASGLTYITVLSLVPTIALAASVAKGFGAWDHLLDTTVEPFLESFVGGDVEVPGEGEAPAEEEGASEGGAASGAEERGATSGAESGEASVELDDSVPPEKKLELRVAIEQILDFVEDTDFRKLGAFGLAFVLFTVIKLLTSIENVLNRIWGVEQARSFVRKVTDYVALVVVTPILLITSTAATGALQSNAFVEYLADDLRLGPVLTLGFKVLPLLSLWLGFGFLYMALPNTRVKILSALIGGILGGTLWQLFQILHVEFQVGVARYNEIYAGFAAFPIFLVWIYMSWVIVLLGAQLAWAHQAEPEYRELMRDVPSTVADREQLAVHAVVAIARAFHRGAGVLSTASLAARFSVPPRAIGQALSPLVDRGVLALVDQGDGYVPARELEKIRLQDVLDAVRGLGPDRPRLDDDPAVDKALTALRADVTGSDHNVPLSVLAETKGAEGGGTRSE